MDLYRDTLGLVREDHSYAGSGDASQSSLSALIKSLKDVQQTKQEICLTGDDTKNTFPIDSKDISIVSSINSGQSHMVSASNKLKATPIVKYDWENRYYYGNLIAVHRSNVYIAYVLPKSKTESVVRLFNRVTAERTLLKNFSGCVCDLGFEFSEEIMIAVIDERGVTYIYKVDTTLPLNDATYLVLQINPSLTSEVSEFNRVIWCPYIPEDTDTSEDCEESNSRIVLITRSNQAEIWFLDTFLSSDQSNVLVNALDAPGGVISIDSHTQPIADAAFAPDASAVATAGLDGDVKFFQADSIIGTNPRCLHHWQPHDGRPLTSLCFLDDHKSPQKCLQFWKYCITGADFNTEIKVWSCLTWACFQTISFLPSPSTVFGAESEKPVLQSVLDLSAKYLVLSDIKRKVLYILEIDQEQDVKASNASFTSVSEFLLTQPCLSVVVTDAKTKRIKQSLNDSHLDEITTGELDADDGYDDRKVDDAVTSPGVLINLFAVHPKLLQELKLLYKKSPNVSSDSKDTFSTNETFRDALSDISLEALTSDLPNNQPILMGPDMFLSNLSRDVTSLGPIDSLDTNSLTSSSSLTHVTPMIDELLSPKAMATKQITPTKTSTLSSKENTPTSILPDIFPLEVDGDLTPTSSIGDGTPRNIVPVPQKLSAREDDAVSTVHGSIDTSPSSSLVTLSLAAEVGIGTHYPDPHQGKDDSPSPAVQPERPITPTPFVSPEFDENDAEVAEVLADDMTDDPLISLAKDDDLPSLHSSHDERPPWPKPPDMVPPELEPTILETSDLEKRADISSERESRHQGSNERNSSDGGKPSELVAVGDISKDSSSGDDNVGDQSSDLRRHDALPDDTINQMQLTMREILATLQHQQREITQLHTALLSQQEQQSLFQQQLQEGAALQTAVSSDTQPDMDAHFVKLEEVMAARVERILSQQANRNHLHLMEIVSSNQSESQKRHDQLVATVTKSLTNGLSQQKMSQTVKQEVKTSVIPSVNKAMEGFFKNHLHAEVARKLTATDSMLKDNINKLVQSKQVIASIGQATGAALKGPIQATYCEAFQNIIIPSFQASCQALYEQINDAFHKGTSDYTKQMETYVNRVQQKLQEERQLMVQQLQATANSMAISVEKLQQSADRQINVNFEKVVEQINGELRQILVSAFDEQKLQNSQAIRGMQESMMTDLRSMVTSELSQLIDRHMTEINHTVVSAVRSTAATPVPPFSSSQLQHITQLVCQDNMNAAFEKALSASSIELVIELCKMVDTKDIFTKVPIPLAQPVLLSLIQQLTFDISSHTELKHKYLSEAILALDATDPITQGHLGAVVKPLQAQLTQFIQTQPQHPMTKHLKMLLMASASLLSSE